MCVRHVLRLLAPDCSTDFLVCLSSVACISASVLLAEVGCLAMLFYLPSLSAVIESTALVVALILFRLRLRIFAALLSYVVTYVWRLQKYWLSSFEGRGSFDYWVCHGFS